MIFMEKDSIMVPKSNKLILIPIKIKGTTLPLQYIINFHGFLKKV